jgi:hypothetical protein
MSKKLSGYINLDKIDKSKEFKTKKGETGVYVDVWINETEDSYGNIAAIKQGANYIGNLKESKNEVQS